MPQQTRNMLYDQVKVGVPINRIMESIENQLYQTGAITCVKKKDLANMAAVDKPLNRKINGRLNGIDLESCFLRFNNLNEISRADENIKFCYYNNLDKIRRLEDVKIVISDPRQMMLLQKHGQRFICVDSTFDITKYDLKLTTIMVIDEFGCGVPVAHYIAAGLKTSDWIFFFVN